MLPITVKILSRHIDPANPAWLHRQTPAGDGVFGNSRFVFDVALREYDYLVVLDDLPPNHSECVDKEKAVLVVVEPPCVKQHSPKYLGQFGTVLTQDQNTRHPGARFTHTGLPWHLWLYSKPEARYADFVGLQPTKTKLMSVICSNKAFTPEHRQRLAFVEKLRQRFGDRIDFFGRGFHEITDKAEALLPYRYHITLENCSIPDYWTEKLADAYLAGCLPLYWGCTNIDKYFPENSFIRLDIENFEAACATIEQVLISDEDAQRHGALEDARQRVLGEHNVFGLLDKIFDELQKIIMNHTNSPEHIVLRSEQTFKEKGFLSMLNFSSTARELWRHPSKISHFFRRIRTATLPIAIADNEANRHQWVMTELASLPKGSTLLDAGAGEQRYKQYCSHLKYISQDFGEYTGAENNNGLHFQQWDTSKIDIVSDITNIPLENAAVDHILCTEVLEHIPDPIAALREFGRLIKQGGTLLLTAPFASLTHFAPYHYATGFNRYFYEYHLPKVGFKIEKLDVNGNYFDVCAQELRRAAFLAEEYSNVHCNGEMKDYIKKVTDFLIEASMKDTGKARSLAAYGLHIRAIKN